MAVGATERSSRFDPLSFTSFRFLGRELDTNGQVALRYGLDDSHEFVERFEIPVSAPISTEQIAGVDGLLSLLHWVAGVSYFKTAAPATVRCENQTPTPAVAALLESLYSEGLGEFAFVNELPSLPRPSFPSTASHVPAGEPEPLSAGARLLVPVGGGKDSIVALETVRRSGCETVLFSVGNAPPMARTQAVAGLPRLVANRRIDDALHACNRAGALNGHVPITAIVACAALLTAALNGFDAVVLANERSASSGNLRWDGIEVNHQFSKSLRAENLLRAAVSELTPQLDVFSVLRPASELSIARAFAKMVEYHDSFTSCNAIFRLDPALRARSWCCDCPKCRFVFLVLAPFSDPAHMREIFGSDLLQAEDQFEGFALLSATGGEKPFECVGEEQESIAAIRLLAEEPRWREHRVVRRLVDEVLPLHPPPAGSPRSALALSDEHHVPSILLAHVHAILGA
jgi:hypothetical protein